MKSSSPRVGDAARVVVFIACILLAVPMLLISLAFIGWRATAAKADEQLQRARAAEASARAAVAAQVAEEEDAIAFAPRSTPSGLLSGDRRSVLEPARETAWRAESIEIVRPVLNEQTGKMEMKKSVQTRYVPVVTTKHVPVFAGHDPAVSRLVGELLRMDEEDENHDRKLDELRQRLELEFATMHDQQEKEIEQTQQRLEALKKLHQQRGENRDKIVQRRIDELLGRADYLEWEINPNLAPGPIGHAGPPHLPSFGPYQAAPPNEFTPQGDQTAPVPSAPTPKAPQPPPAAGNFFNPFGSGAPTTTFPPGTAPALNPVQAWDPHATPPLQPPTPSQPIPPSQPPQWIEEREERIIMNDPTVGRFEASAPTISRIFELARKSSAAQTALQSAESKLERFNKMLEKSVIPSTELEQAKANLIQIRREVELSRLEFQALGDSMRRTQANGEEQARNAQKLLELAETRVKQGLAPTSELIAAEREVGRARERLEEARANLEQLDRAKALIRGSEDQEEEAEVELERAEELSDDSTDQSEVEIIDVTEESEVEAEDTTAER